MTHWSEGAHQLSVTFHDAQSTKVLLEDIRGFNDVCLLRLPTPSSDSAKTFLKDSRQLVRDVCSVLGSKATLVVIGDIVDLVHVHEGLSELVRYQLWIAIKLLQPRFTSSVTTLPHDHLGALVYTKYDGQLKHTKTRLAYTYCPACNKTTKDYGGKKHTYHEYGTLISDVWRDIAVEPDGNMDEVIERFADLFGIDAYSELQVYNLENILTERKSTPAHHFDSPPHSTQLASQLLNGDCLEQLQKLPDNSIDFAFADPPYNLKKEYRGYADDLKIKEYFDWCDSWISEVARVLRPGSTFALLNIPLWAIRHFLHLETVLNYENWIVWDALSFPVRMIMPAHYTILCFSKGTPRQLPGLTGESGIVEPPSASPTFRALQPLGEGYCLRSQCISKRTRVRMNDRGVLSDVWWDIHRLKHNTRRVDHPCQLPPQLMYRLIGLYTQPGEIVLDCFNGAGTTTLAAHQLGRRYVGIEREIVYHELAQARHIEIESGLDPFRKEERELTAKNSPVARLKKQKYEVSKKTLQLEVRRVAQMIGHLPTRDEMIQLGEYSIRYYDEYFISWGEVCAAARTTGMTEDKDEYPEGSLSQKRLF
jgi:site-specific DNA-methyltransferase (adenine-specific)